jgi:uncharacterized protein (TIGR03790 family)
MVSFSGLSRLEKLAPAFRDLHRERDPEPTAPAPIPADQVAILYNSADPDSKTLAETYAQARAIPAANIIALPLSKAEEISRDEFNTSLLTPLRATFDKQQWWTIGRVQDGTVLASSSRIKVLVTMRGVPLKIARKAGPPLPPGQSPKSPVDGANEASVDAELALLSVRDLPIDGPARNPFFDNKTGIMEANMPFMLLVGRIDGPDLATCKRMIQDAIDTEKTGLWGRAYYDLSEFHPDGDKWIRSASLAALDYGIPTEVHPWKETYPLNYPMRDAALYFGWYEWTACGPFTRSGSLRKGSVAVHLHSFSASTVRSSTANWCGPLLSRGAAATVGNVYEPYLHLTHQLDAFQKALLTGSTLVEAAYSSIPALSWQAVVLGDPLYRPFLHLDGTGEKSPGDKVYRALRVAKKLHDLSDSKYLSEIDRIGREKKNPVFLENLGLIYLSRREATLAKVYFKEAKLHYTDPADRLHCDLHLIGIERSAGRKSEALRALSTYKYLSSLKSL